MSLNDEAADIELWLVDLDDARWDALAWTLSAAEAAHAARYRTEALRRDYSRCRSALRQLLARRTGVQAQRLVFGSGAHGKPQLEGHDCQFNVSHSGRRGLIALAQCAIGVDLELADRGIGELDELVRVVCHPAERVQLAASSGAARAALFYQLWTRKEAYCKALGVGLALRLDALQVGVVPGQGARVNDAQAGGPTPWHVHPVGGIEGYAASVCTTAREARMALRRLAPV